MSNPIVPMERTASAAAPRARTAPIVAGQAAVPHGTSPRPSESPLLLFQRYLRGRYPIAAALALAFCIPCAVVGRYAIPPIYKSTGLVRVAPTLPKLLYQNEENQLMPMFDAFVSLQSEILQSPRILQDAVQSSALRAAGWPDSPAGAAMLGGALEVSAPRGSEIITVTISSRHASVAQAAVNAVLDSYAAIEEDLNGANVERTEGALEQRVKDLQARLDSLRQQILQLSTEHGSDDLGAMKSAKADSLIRLNASIEQLDLEISRAQAVGPSASTGAEPVSPSSALAIASELAKRDPILGGLLEQQARLRVEYATMVTKLAPTHRSMQALQHRIDALGVEIAGRTTQLGALPLVELTGNDGATSMTGAEGAHPLAQLQATRAAQVQLRDAAFDELRALASTRMQFETLRESADETKRDLDDAKTRLEQMRVERQNTKSGRISIIQRGDFPISPSTDRRRPLTVFGGLFGAGIGIGLVWAYGFLRNGYRYVDDLEHATGFAPVLGVIPDLAQGKAEEEEQAAFSVHHIRNSLQLHAGSGALSRVDDPNSERGVGDVFTVTSPMAGDGKTHLSLALGLSFAMSGRRTLLVDTDLIGRGLTHELGLDLARGLTEAVGADTLNGEVHLVRPNLSAIPAGASATFRPEELSTRLMDRLLCAARASFDTVIVDSGPIMGSLEANLASPLSDCCVLVVSRGQSPRSVKAALARLRSSGASCAGIVFNRAIPKDFFRSTSVVSTSKRLPGASRRSRSPATSELARVMQRDRVEPNASRSSSS